ncbi:MAG: hypothetical protein J6M39_08090 [Lachnospiraceae bacterium]|nr:hypothetical protein [Lachnospiraceae bacterium]
MHEWQKALNNNNTLEGIRKVKISSEKQIVDGINNHFASTGKPIKDLHGASKFSAMLANIGGGAKRIGGNGMEGGISTISKYDIAKTLLKIIDNINIIFRKPVTLAKLLK